MVRTKARVAGAAGVALLVLAPFAASAPPPPPPCNKFTGGTCISVSVAPNPMMTPVNAPFAALAAVTGSAGETLVFASISDAANVFSFNDPQCMSGGGPHSCLLGSGGLLTPVTLVVDCTPMASGTFVGTITVLGPGADTDQATMTCATIESPPDPGQLMFTQTPAPIAVAVNTLGATSVGIGTTGGSDHLVSATLTGPDAASFSFADARCAGGGGSACTFMPPVALGATSFAVQCTPPDVTQRTAMLVVTGSGIPTDQVTTPLTCTGQMSMGSGPVLQVSPSSLDLTAPVGGMITSSTNVSDVGGATLLVSTAISSGSDVFTAVDCLGGCSIGSGSGSAVRVSFAPTTWGTVHGTLALSSNDPMQMNVPVALTGHGSGGELQVSPLTITLGPLPLNSPQTVAVTLHDFGNIALTTTVGPTSGPFSTSATTVASAPGTDGMLGVTCGSSSPTTGSASTSITLSTPAAYAGSAQSIAVMCEIADTNIQVSPLAFDFGEHRVGEALAPQTLTITNPTSSTVTIDALGLLRDAPGLTLSGPTGVMALPPGAQLTATLALSSAQAVDLGTPREAVTIDLTEPSGPKHLELTVTGNVGTASSTLVPTSLDLGTACVGHTVTAAAVLTNTGPIALHVQQPTIDTDFAVTLADPTSYPPAGAILAADGSAQVTISPISSAAGSASGVLTWTDDVPNKYEVPIALTYKDSGAAISPLDLPFGTVPVGISSSASTVVVENCGSAATTFEIGAINPVTGTGHAWAVTPSGTQALPPHGQLAVTITFAPHYADAYNASLQLIVDGAPTAVRLTGTGAGSTTERTFYGCGCEGGGSPERSLPLVAAVALIIRRRRRGSS